MKKRTLGVLLLILIIIAGAGFFLVRPLVIHAPSADSLIGEPREATFTNADGDRLTVDFNHGRAVINGIGYSDLEFVQATTGLSVPYTNETEQLQLWDSGEMVSVFRNGQPVFIGSTNPDSMGKIFKASDGLEGVPPPPQQLPPPILPIQKQSWMWEETVAKDGTVTMPRRPESFTITFGPASELSGTTDCNSFSGKYSISGDEVMFGLVNMTEMACEGSQEAQFIEPFLQASVTAKFTAEGNLGLSFGDGNVMGLKPKP